MIDICNISGMYPDTKKTVYYCSDYTMAHNDCIHQTIKIIDRPSGPASTSIVDEAVVSVVTKICYCPEETPAPYAAS